MSPLPSRSELRSAAPVGKQKGPGDRTMWSHVNEGRQIRAPTASVKGASSNASGQPKERHDDRTSPHSRTMPLGGLRHSRVVAECGARTWIYNEALTRVGRGTTMVPRMGRTNRCHLRRVHRRDFGFTRGALKRLGREPQRHPQ